jgi:hypothetical protein
VKCIYRTCGVLLVLSGLFCARASTVVYSSIPTPLPPNVPSQSYEGTSTSQFGNAIDLASGPRLLTTITIVMSDWAKESTYETVGSAAGFYVPLTLNLYSFGPGGAVGPMFGSQTVDAFIPWRPEPTGACPPDTDGERWLASDGNCYHGIAATVQFDFTGLNILLPQQLVFGLAFNTQNYGADPTRVPGPYNSLNFGSYGDPTVGTNVYPNGAYVDALWSGAYNGGGTTGTFRLDNARWGGYSPEIEINAAPEPATWLLLGSAFGLVGVFRRTRS